MIAGTPRSVLVELRNLLRVLHSGVLIMRIDGPMTREERRSCIRLLGQEVVAAPREIGDDMGLDDPFTVKPGSGPLPPTGKPQVAAIPAVLKDFYSQ